MRLPFLFGYICGLLLCLGMGVIYPVSATTLDIGTNTRVFVPMKSFKALRDENMVKQAYDYSCGAAAFATLLTYGLGDPVTEQEVLEAAFRALSQDEEALRKKEGLSLLDLQRLAQARGHKAQGFRIEAKFLSHLRGPVIVFIKPRGYEHFAVLKAVRGDRAYLADPSLGNVRMPMYKFLAMWLDDSQRGIIFVAERGDGMPTPVEPLGISEAGTRQPEVFSVRQLLEIGSSFPHAIQPINLQP